mgnify:CR=1 FL=1
MLSDNALTFIVLGPGLAALVAGLFQKIIGDRGSMVVTTGIVGIAGLLSLYQLFAYAAGAGHAEHVMFAADAAASGGYAGPHIIKLMTWMDVGGFKADMPINLRDKVIDPSISSPLQYIGVQVIKSGYTCSGIRA